MAAKHYFKSHRIQAGKAIVSLVLRDEKPLHDGGWLLEWVGDAYEMVAELNTIISDLERKYAHRKAVTT